MCTTTPRQLTSALLYFSGAAVAIFVTGRHDVTAAVAAAVGAALGMIVGRPSDMPGWQPVLLSLLFAAAAAAALLPAAVHLPSWRVAVPEAVALAGSLAAMPGHLLFWWLALAGTIVAGWCVLAAPLDVRALQIFLHAVAGLVAAYAIVSIVQTHTAWSYPFSGGANFGLLPNRNHTATLLVVGSIVSFGLMQWEVARGHRISAALAALWGAPSLAALLFFSTSRAGVVFLAVGFVLWTVGAIGTAIKRRTALSAAGVLAAFLLILLVLGGSTVRDRLGQLWSEVIRMEAGDGEVRQVDFRQPVFRDTLRMIQDAPLTGQGMGHFEFVFPHYREYSLTTSRVLHPESDWLMVAAESGVPAVLALLGLVAWYFASCWRGRRESGGLLRWTVASAIGAALAHGIIDVPWHRPALGWFLLTVALVSVPPGRGRLRLPLLWRGLQVLVGATLLAAAAYLGWSATTYRPPLVYRWEGYSAELEALLKARKFDDGEFVAREAIEDFRLHYQAYYWRAAFLRMFEGTDGEMKRDVAAGRFVEPVLPRVAAEQAQVWKDIDNFAEAEARAEAIRRAALIEERSGVTGVAAGELEKGVRAAQDRPAVQAALRDHLKDDPVLLAHWVLRANAELVQDYLCGLGSAAGAWLDGLPSELRRRVLDRWASSPSAAGAVGYMEGRGGAKVYGSELANVYAREGDKERAVRVVAEAEGVDLDGRAGWGDGEWGRQVEELETLGNIVAVRRLAREAVAAKDADAVKLAAVMTWAAGRGDWEAAWKAASQLVRATKKGQ
jgi:O-antigen ligase